jgi:uncharacterized membrane protein
VVRGFADTAPLSSALGWTEAGLACVYFLCAILYVGPYKKEAKRLARLAIEKANREDAH